jgi:hypothetical protein
MLSPLPLLRSRNSQVIEFPSDTLDPGWETNVIELDSGRTVEVVTLEDIILDRIEGVGGSHLAGACP